MPLACCSVLSRDIMKFEVNVRIYRMSGCQKWLHSDSEPTSCPNPHFPQRHFSTETSNLLFMTDETCEATASGLISCTAVPLHAHCVSMCSAVLQGGLVCTWP